VTTGEAAQAALADSCWVEVESTWGWYTATDVASLVEALPHAVASVQWRGEQRFRAFQFVRGVDGGPMLAPAWVGLRDLLSLEHWADADMLAWAAAPNPSLGGRSPAEEIRNHPHGVSKALAHAVDMAITARAH
jgi:hypothetical protein